MKQPETSTDGAETGPPPDGFGVPGEEQAPAEAPSDGPAFNLYGLRNSEPHVTPAEVGQQLDIAAEWYEHLQCGFIKQSGGEGTEAWMHYAMAGVILFQRTFDDSTTETEGQQAEAEGDGRFERDWSEGDG